MSQSASPTKAVDSSSATPSSMPANERTPPTAASTPGTDQRGYFEKRVKDLSLSELCALSGRPPRKP